jgi:hypothetical protein
MNYEIIGALLLGFTQTYVTHKNYDIISALFLGFTHTYITHKNNEIIGALFLGFTQTYITHKNYEIIGALFCGMKEDDVNTFGQHAPTDKTCYIYRKCDYTSALVCECNYDIRPEYAHSFVNQVSNPGRKFKFI